MVCLWKPSNQSSLIFGREQLVDLTSNCSIEGKLLFRTQFCSTKDKDKDHEKMAECFSCNKAVTSHHLLTVGGKYKMQSWKRGFKQFPKLRLGKYLVLKIYIFVICKLLERSRCLLWLKQPNHIFWFTFSILLSCTLSVWHVPHARNPWCRLASTGESWVWGIIWE